MLPGAFQTSAHMTVYTSLDCLVTHLNYYSLKMITSLKGAHQNYIAIAQQYHTLSPIYTLQLFTISHPYVNVFSFLIFHQ